MPLLRITLPDQSEITHELVSDRVTVGRRPDNTIQILDRSVSAYHAELVISEGHYRLHDLGSTNLTFVNGSPVIDYHLHDICRIAFGTVQCEFDPVSTEGEFKLSPAQMEKDIAFLRGDNAELQGRINTLQRQIDILNSARLVTKRSEITPFAVDNENLRAITSERDDLRHLSAGLKLELEKLRSELRETAHERDLARQKLDLMKAEKVISARSLQEVRQAIPANGSIFAPPTPNSLKAGLTVIEQTTTAARFAPAHGRHAASLVARGSKTAADDTQRITLPLPPDFAPIPVALAPVSAAIELLTGNPGDQKMIGRLSNSVAKLVESVARLGHHPVSRLVHTVETASHEFAADPLAPNSTILKTLGETTTLLSRILDVHVLDRCRGLPHPKVLVVDQDAGVLDTLTATLELAQLPTTAATSSEQALGLVEAESFDLLLLDATAPELEGRSLGEHIRANERYGKTPILTLASANGATLNSESLGAFGNDVIALPFNAAELTARAELWIWRNRFGLL